MSKIMISISPMGKTEEEIIEEQHRMAHKLFTYYNHDDCEIRFPSTEKEQKYDLECLSEAIYLMSKCDAVCFGDNWEQSTYCQLEKIIAEKYDMQIIYFKELEE